MACRCTYLYARHARAPLTSNSDHGIGYSHKSQQVATAAICASTFYSQSSYMLVAGELEPPSSALITAIKPAFFKAL